MRHCFGHRIGCAPWSSKPGSKRPFSPRRRALALEPLEDRRLLSVAGLGVVGDSLSDEYFDQVPPAPYARNWVELLPVRGVNVGEYRALPDTWPDVREQGYQFNWAVAGATSASLLADGQHTGLAQQAVDGLVTHAVLAIGQNDYWPPGTAYQEIYAGTWTDAQIEAHNAGILANIKTAVDTLVATGVNLVISDVIDYGVTPFAHGIAPDPVGRQRVADAIGELNIGIQELAFDRGCPWVKSGVMVKDYLGEHGAEVPSLLVGGVEITNTAGIDPHSAFVGDGIHPHTVLQGFFGNLFAEAFNLGFDAGIPLLSEEEILIEAGIVGEYVEDTLDLAPEDYVVLPVDYDWGDAPDAIPGTRPDGVYPVGSDFRISQQGPDGDENYDAQYPAIACNRWLNQYLVVWQGPRSVYLDDPELEIYGQIIDANDGSTVVDDFRISAQGPDDNVQFDAETPVVAFDPNTEEYLVAWTGDRIPGEDEIFAQRVLFDGTLMGSNTRISTQGADGDTNTAAGRPAIAYNSTDGEFLVVWHGDAAVDDEMEVYGQRIAGDGTLLGANFPISNQGIPGERFSDALNPDVAYSSGDNEYTVIWQGDRIPGEVEIFGQHIDPDGTLDGDNFRISEQGPDGDVGYDAEEPAIAYSIFDERFLVAWQGDADAVDDDEIFGTFVWSAQAEIPPPTPSVIFQISVDDAIGHTSGRRPRIVTDSQGNRIMVGWESDSPSDPNSIDVLTTCRTVESLASEPESNPSVIGSIDTSSNPLSDYYFDLDYSSPNAGAFDTTPTLVSSSDVGGETEIRGQLLWAGPADYQTRSIEDGARHIIGGPLLGAGVDAESDAIPDADALGDDNDNTDDENGVLFTTSKLFASNTASITGSLRVDLQNADPTSNFLDGWIDFNRDGVWDDGTEKILDSVDLGTTSQVIPLTFTVPQDTGANVERGDTFARFRLSTTGGLLPTGEAADGEVEDYRVTIVNEGLGQITSNEMPGLEPLAADLWYRMTTSQAGFLTAAAVCRDGETAILTLYDENGNELDHSATGSGEERVEHDADDAGEVNYLKLAGTSIDVDLKLLNLVHHDDTTVNVSGTDGPDNFAFDATAPYLVTVNGLDYEFPAPDLSAAFFDGFDGDDEFTYGGSADAEWTTMWPNHLRIEGPAIVETQNTENATANSGGGDDVAQLYGDFEGDDIFYGHPIEARLYDNVGTFLNRVTMYRYLHAYGGAGDTATFDGSANGQDWFVGTPEFGQLSGQRDDGADFFARANGFDEVIVNSGGGSDVAELQDSSAKDELTVDPDTATLFGPGYYLEVRDFQWVHTEASDDGEEDTAELNGSATGQDRFIGTPDYGQLSGQRDDGSGFFIRGRGFTRIIATSRGGSDVAELQDSSAKDELTADPDTATLFGPHYYLEVRDFQWVHTEASDDGEEDTAELNGSATGQDRFIGRPQEGQLWGLRDDGSEFYIRGRGFTRIIATSRGGGDVAELQDSSGKDELTADPDTATLFGPGYYLEARDFQWVHTEASDDGEDDTAELSGSATGQDWFIGTPDYAQISGHRDDGSPFFIRGNGFPVLTVNSGGGDDVAELYDSPGEDELTADPGLATLSTLQTVTSAILFRHVHAYFSEDGQEDSAELTGSATGENRFIAKPGRGRLSGRRGDGTYFSHRIVNADRIVAVSDAVNDLAQLYDSPGDDVLEAYPDSATMSYQDGTSAEAVGFPYLHAYGSLGYDMATLYDTTSDGLTSYTTNFTAKVLPNGRHLRRMTCNYGPYLGATDFDYTRAVSTPGQNDVVQIYDSALSDTYEAYCDQVTMTYEDGTVIRADNYGYTHAYARNGGFNTATLYDTTADGLTSHTTEFTAKVLPNGRHLRRMTCDYGTYRSATDFDFTRAVSTPGRDGVALFYDSDQPDWFEAYVGHATMDYGDGKTVQAENYRYTHAYSRIGGADSATLHDQTIGGTSYVTTFRGDADSCRLFSAGNGFFSQVVEFEEVRAALGGDNDEAYLFDDPTRVDHLIVPFDGDLYNAPAKAKFFNNDRVIYIDGFLWLRANTSEDFVDDKIIDPAYAAAVILEGNWADP